VCERGTAGQEGGDPQPPVTLRGTSSTTQGLACPFPLCCINDVKKSNTDKTTPLTPPIVLASAFAFESAEGMIEAARQPGQGDLYSRWSNPTLEYVEDALRKLEGAERALLTASGMSAIHIALMSALTHHKATPGVLLVQNEIYGATHELVSHILEPLGIHVQRAPLTHLAKASRALPPRSVIYAEVPTNPLIRVADIKSVRESAPQDALVIVDATFASPVNVLALSLGADLVVHSATKYLGGHHDLLAGVIAGNDTLMAHAWSMRKLFGPVLDPAAAYRLWRGLETLSLRVETQNASAAILAERLSNHSKVEQVHYPTLLTHPDHELAKRTMSGCGGVLSFEVKGGPDAAARVINATTHIKRAASLGGVSTLITWPAGVTHVGLNDAERKASGVRGGLLRLAIGVESVEVLWKELNQVLTEST